MCFIYVTTKSITLYVYVTIRRSKDRTIFIYLSTNFKLSTGIKRNKLLLFCIRIMWVMLLSYTPNKNKPLLNHSPWWKMITYQSLKKLSTFLSKLKIELLLFTLLVSIKYNVQDLSTDFSVLSYRIVRQFNNNYIIRTLLNAGFS